jgi:SAM-dependent methyltransferase
MDPAMSSARQASAGEGTGNFAEPLADSAPIAWAEAPRRCHRNPDTGETCLWYHRVWQYLRLLGIKRSIRTDTEFLITNFRERARSGRYPRVLVSATADYAMLAHLTYAYGMEDRALEATVVDRCETSLLLNRWYAERYHIAITTECYDLVEYAARFPFDMVCTHNVLTFFDEESRRRLVDRWHALLRPGGVVVTAQRVHPNSSVGRKFYTNEQAHEVSEKVAAAARACPQQLNMEIEELAQAVYGHMIRRGWYVIRTSREITDLFEAAGFDIEFADEGEKIVDCTDLSLSAADKHKYRMRIVARKR